MFKIYKWIAIIVIVLSIVIGVGFMAYGTWFKGDDELKIDKTENVVTSIRRIAELSTMNYYEEFTLETSKRTAIADNIVGDAVVKVFGNKADKTLSDKLVIIAKGHVRAGFDLTKIKDGDVRISGDTLYLSIPNPEILNAVVNPSDFEVFIEDGSWTHEQVQQLENKAIAELKQHAIQAGVLRKAKENGIAELRNMYMAFGFKEVCFRNENQP